jgi:peptidoglycan/LPS O-acetylase OafA/YrhL
MLPGKPELFPLNGPFWSLFFELIANFIYGALVRVLSTKAILGIMAFAALVSLPGARVWGSFDTGFTWGALSIASGWGRATFGVFAGLLLFRHRAGLSLWLRGAIGPLFNPWLGLALLCAILASPPLIAYNWLLDAALVFGLFPMITLMCSAPIHARWSTLMLSLGAISYPLYVLHRVVARIIEQVVEKLAGPEILTQIAPFGGIALIAFLAVLCLWLEKVFDIPLRKRLRARFLPARTKPAQAAPAE